MDDTDLATLAILVGLLLVAGGLLFFYGARRRRVGDEPHCRRCGYNLTGLVSERCPECGGLASGKNVVIGTPQRRWRAFLLGVLLLLLAIAGGGVGGYIKAREINWYPHLPAFVLVRLARTDDLAAIWELTRRYENGSLSDKRVLDLPPIALAKPPPPPGAFRPWERLLAALDSAEVLTEGQRGQFYESIESFELEFAPTVRQGERVVFTIRVVRTLPELNVRGRVVDATLRVGTWERRLTTEARESVPYMLPLDTRDFDPGEYRVEFDAKRVFLHGDDRNWGEPILVRDLNRVYQLEILPADAPD